MAEPAQFVRYTEQGLTTRVEAHNLRPEHRFSLEFLERESQAPRVDGHPYLEWDGQRIVLNLSNGRWVYAVTGYEDLGRVVLGRWPD